MSDIENRNTLLEAVGELFGFKLKKKESVELPSFVPKEYDDGALTISPSGIFGEYLDLEGRIFSDHELVSKYRELALQPEIDFAVNDIVSEAVVIDDIEEPVSVDVDDIEFSDKIKESIREEFQNVVSLLNFNNRGHDIFRQWYVDGRLYYHAVVAEGKEKGGIKEIRNIDPRKIRKIREIVKEPTPGYANIIKTTDEYFVFNPNGFIDKNSPSTSGMKISKDAIIYVTSGLYDAENTLVLSNLHKTIKPYNMLKMLEDAAVIYYLSRAPERRIFYIDVGNLPKAKADQYVAGIMGKYRNKMVYDAETGNVRDDKRHMCLAMDTKVPLLDGRILTIQEIADEYSQEKPLWVYSCNPITGEFAPGLVSWAGVTRRDAEVVKITLDNGKDIICTPDHKFPVWNKGFVRADALSIGESMIPHYNQKETIGTKHIKYEQIFDNSAKTWEFTHRLVSKWKDINNIENEYSFDEEYRDQKKTVVHHKNMNQGDNSPENLVRMFYKDHFRMHRKLGTNGGKITKELKLGYFNSKHEDYTKWHIDAGKIGGRVSSDTGKSHQNFEKGREILSELMSNPDWNKWFRERQVDGWTAEARESASMRAKKSNLSAMGNDAICKLYKDKNSSLSINHGKLYKTEYPESIIAEVISAAEAQISVSDVIRTINSNQGMMEEFGVLNSNKVTKKQKDFTIINSADISRISDSLGYKSYSNMKDSVKFKNHKIVSIEFLTERIDTGCITVDEDEKYHNYHTFALDAGIYTKNSMLEDFWIPRREGGKGTEITTLGGGNNLTDNIESIEYFRKKLFKALNVPYSRMDSENQWSLGRTTEISRDEMRFARFIDRLRSKFNILFDEILGRQLILKRIVTESDWNNIKKDIKYRYNKDSYFSEMKDIEVVRERFNLLRDIDEYSTNAAARDQGKHPEPWISNAWIRKNVLQQNDDDIKAMNKEIKKELEKMTPDKEDGDSEVGGDDVETETNPSANDNKDSPEKGSGQEQETEEGLILT